MDEIDSPVEKGEPSFLPPFLVSAWYASSGTERRLDETAIEGHPLQLAKARHDVGGNSRAKSLGVFVSTECRRGVLLRG
jgi:hypothetical protein